MLKTDPKMSMNKAKELAKQNHLCYGMICYHTGNMGFQVQWYVGEYEELVHIPDMQVVFNEDETKLFSRQQ